jgi:hypothetical protein
MKSLLFCLALAVLPGFSEQRGALSAPIVLYTQFQQQPPAAVLEALQKELDSVMAPMGLSFEWRSLSGVQGDEVSAELAVVNFKGRCDTGSLAPHGKNPGALGWTHVSDGAILPFSDVDCDHVRTFLQGQLLYTRREAREQVFGRALGRVLAHELYHVFANTSVHGACGIGKAAYTVKELVSEVFQFEQREMGVLRASRLRVTALNTFSPHAGTP